jgi:PPOX class probable F420-dependent enzyme
VIPLDDTVCLATGKNLATVVTLMPDGQPQALLTWVDTDGERILVNTEPQRQKMRNVARDPRGTVLIHSADDPMDWSEARGQVVSATDGEAPGPHERVIPAIGADKINTPRLLGQ